MTLVEVFAYLTDTLLYRVNRVPEKAFAQFLELIGVRVLPPAAASVDLVFSLSAAGRPTTSSSPVAAGWRRPGADDSPRLRDRRRRHDPGRRDGVDRARPRRRGRRGRVARRGHWPPGQVVRVQPPPITLPDRATSSILSWGWKPARGARGSRAGPGIRRPTYRIWTEVEHFGAPPARGRAPPLHRRPSGRGDHLRPGRPARGRRRRRRGSAEQRVMLADAPAGAAPSWPGTATAAEPTATWRPDTLTTMKDPVPGVKVTNPAAAAGGRDGSRWRTRWSADRSRSTPSTAS